MCWIHILVFVGVTVRSSCSLESLLQPVDKVVETVKTVSGSFANAINDSALKSPDWPDDYSYYLNDGDTFDHIVVGAGAGGAAVAATLALDGLKPLLVEAGDNPNLVTRIPGAAMGNLESPMDWAYRSVSNNMSCLSSFNDQCRFSRGKALGGSTSINYMMYVRGNPQDYDCWNWPGWSWKDLKPYFLKYEGYQHLNDLSDSSEPFHNTDGIVKVGLFQDSENAWHERLKKGYESLNIPYNFDINAESQIGVTQVAGFTFDGERESTATAYLTNDKVKSVLKVAKNTLCTGLIIDEQKVVRGIKVRINNLLSPKYLSIYSKHDVVLSAGTVGNPQILMLSGIGPADHLQEMGIPVVADQPVGENMSDHVLSLTFAKVDRGFSQGLSTVVTLAAEGDAAVRWAASKDGPLASNGLTDVTTLFNINCYDFKTRQLVNNNDSDCNLPDSQMIHAYIDTGLIPLAQPVVQNILQFETDVVNQISKANEKHALLVYSPIVIQPKSKGHIRLKSLDPTDDPAIFPNYLGEQEDADQLAELSKVLVDLTRSDMFREYGAEMLLIELPGCPEPNEDSAEYWECYARHMTYSVYHAAGTTHGALTPRLEVKGVSNLRVADLSAAPYVPRGNTAALAIAFGERLADFLREERECENNKK